jgi:hypothetical protein
VKQNKNNNNKELVIQNSKSRQHEKGFKIYFRKLLSLIEVRPVEQNDSSNAKICHEITIESLKYVMSLCLINAPSVDITRIVLFEGTG